MTFELGLILFLLLVAVLAIVKVLLPDSGKSK